MSTTTILDLFRQYNLAIFRYFRRMTGRHDLAEDLTQDLFLRVLKGIRRYEEQDREKAWIYRIARNLLLDHWKTQSKRPIQADTNHEFTPSQPPTQFLGLRIERSLQKLPDADREALVLREVGGLSYDEIAEVTSTSTGSVRSRIFRTRLALRDDLVDELRTAQAGRPMEMTS